MKEIFEKKFLDKINPLFKEMFLINKLGLLLVFICTVSLIRAQVIPVKFNTTAGSPANPKLKDYVLSGIVTSNLKYDTTGAGNLLPVSMPAYIYGKIISSNLTITTTTTSLILFLTHNVPVTLTPDQLSDAFGDFSPNNITISDPNIDPNNIRLPDGTYQICFYARQNDCSGQFCELSDPNLGCAFFTVSCSPLNGAQITTTVINSIRPQIAQAIQQGDVSSRIQVNSSPSCNTQVKLFGKIERLTPSPFSIELKPNSQTANYVLLSPGTTQLSANQMLSAFNNFDESDLLISGINLASIKDASNQIKLPDGNYRICFYAKYLSGSNASNPSLGCASFTITCNPINGAQIITRAINPINPLITQAIQSGNINSSIQFNPSTGCDTRVGLYGKIERISPSPFSIALNTNHPSPLITINPGITQLTPKQLMDAFNNFNDNTLTTSGINLASIKDANNQIKLPSGDYRICFYGKYSSGDNASDPNLGCASFNICNKSGGAPQFTQPVNTVNVNSDLPIVQPVSPVIFSWTPPQSTCGLPPAGYVYDFDIWELYPNQTVTDAINNPFVFRKKSLPSATFLLDLNLFKDVLKPGKRYAIRVRAISNNPASPIEIDNDGYSRIEAFQYGGGPVPPILTDPKDYFIEFKERKSGYWSNAYNDYKQRRRADTLVPVKEYIAFALTQNGIGYGADAIELFLALNPDLIELKKVKLSYIPNLPVFPLVSGNDQKNFDKEHQANLEPNQSEENKFLKYLDTLNNFKQKIPEKAVSMINELVRHLNSIKPEINTVDQVTVSYINQVIAELLFELRLYSRNSNVTQFNQLQKLAVTLQELTADSIEGTSLLWPGKIRSSLSLSQSGPNAYSYDIDLLFDNELIDIDHMPATLVKQLLPFDVIVWRPGKVDPYKPVLDAPDLKATFRIYYTLANLYNRKNPEINAKTSSRLASTIQLSLPSNSIFSFWTLNMGNHKMTTAENVDLRDVLKNSMKNEPRLKKPSVVIKVD
jgi:hypothetical protein